MRMVPCYYFGTCNLSEVRGVSSSIPLRDVELSARVAKKSKSKKVKPGLWSG